MHSCLYIHDNQLSQVICNYQKLNYTIVIATHETAEQRNVSLGPYRHYGAGTITQSVSTALLKQDSEHSLFVVLNTITGSASSQEYTFGKPDSHNFSPYYSCLGLIYTCA